MRQKTVLAVVVAILVAAAPIALAQEDAPDKAARFGHGRCSPTGIWYGGSVVDDTGVFFKWLLNVTPNFGGRFIIFVII